MNEKTDSDLELVNCLCGKPAKIATKFTSMGAVSVAGCVDCGKEFAGYTQADAAEIWRKQVELHRQLTMGYL